MLLKMKRTLAGPLEYNEAESARVSAIYRSPDIVRQRQAVIELLAPSADQRILDVGCGPGLQLSDLARARGSAASLVGVDTSAAMLALAADELASRDQGDVELVHGDATALPFPDASFDSAIVTQVYEWIPDVPKALAELHRVLRPEGRAIVLDSDWQTLVWHADDPQRNGRIAERWRARLAHPHLPRTLARELTREGFVVEGTEVFVIHDRAGSQDSYSRLQADHMAYAVSAPRSPSVDEAGAWLDDLAACANEGVYFFSLNRYLFLARRAA